MVVISQLPDDGSNGGDPNKNPKELHENHQEDDENQNKNPHEDDDENQNKNPHEDDDEDQQEDDDEDPHEDDDEDQQEDDDEDPQEAENLPDALQLQQDQVENLLNAPQLPQDQVENLPDILLILPQHISENIVARVRRCDYSALLLTSRGFRQFMASEGLYEERLYSGLAESILYVLIGSRFPYSDNLRWYILYRNIPRNITLRLSQLSSILHPMFPGCAVVTIGHNMYVMGGLNNFHPTKSVYLIDCRLHTCVPLPDMHRARFRAAAGVINGKIYVIGGCERRYIDWVEEFDVQTRIWTTRRGPYPKALSLRGEIESYVVMQEKIYILEPDQCSTYEPTQRRWDDESQLQNYWRGWSSCVIDQLLYTFDPYRTLGNLIMVYEPNDKIWRPVRGKYDLPNFVYYDTRIVNFDGKLTIVGPVYSQFSHRVYWIEIALEEREGGEIWGKVVSRALVLRSETTPYIELCRSVRV